ncbi:MAG: hypothetical protein CVV60_04745 [Tenericutes bacterium HGW-Tenericutes-5]|nr:MAG: hypothetical protein CVV60_04745 [Tenericutes bacterium HGW-Tenericutes-5]
MKLAFQIAKRFLLASKRQTLVIILGIAVGVSVQVFIGALIAGLQTSLVNTTIGSRSQITITLEDEYISDYQTILPRILLVSDRFFLVSILRSLDALVARVDNLFFVGFVSN